MGRRIEIELVKDRLSKCADCIFHAPDVGCNDIFYASYVGCNEPKGLDCGIDAMDEHWEIVKDRSPR